MNLLEFRSPLGDAPMFFAPKDSETVQITLTSPAGRPTELAVDGHTNAEHDQFGERWYVKVPVFEALGRWTLLFDQDGVDTTYYIDVYDEAAEKAAARAALLARLGMEG